MRLILDTQNGSSSKGKHHQRKNPLSTSTHGGKKIEARVGELNDTFHGGKKVVIAKNGRLRCLACQKAHRGSDWVATLLRCAAQALGVGPPRGPADPLFGWSAAIAARAPQAQPDLPNADNDAVSPGNRGQDPAAAAKLFWTSFGSTLPIDNEPIIALAEQRRAAQKTSTTACRKSSESARPAVGAAGL